MIEKIIVDEDAPPKQSFVDKLFGIFGMKRVEPETRLVSITRKHDWKDWEVDYLRDNYETLKLREMAVFLDRPISTIYSKMQREGIIKKKD
jgi:hypothetical protein